MRALAMDNFGFKRHRITVDEYYRMTEVGLIAPDARVELIEGEIIDMASIGSPHGAVVDILNHALVHAVGDRAIVRVQGPVRLSRYSEPVPDLAVLKPKERGYRAGHPSGLETYLLIEVSETSLRYDREIKVPLYARHEVPEVWIVNLRHEKIHFYQDLKEGAYSDVSFTSKPGVIELSMLSGVTVNLSEVFG